MTDLLDMKRTEADKKKAEESMKPTMEGPDYPWGLCLNLSKQELDKIGIKELPKVGDEYHVLAIASVRSARSSSSDSGEDSSIELQIEHLMLVPEDEAEEASSADTMYPEKE